MEIHNYMEDVASDILENILAEHSEVCSCAKCKADILALALNSLPPKYIVSQKGRVYTKLAELQLQFRTDVVTELAKALDVVKNRPQHNDGSAKQ